MTVVVVVAAAAAATAVAVVVVVVDRLEITVSFGLSMNTTNY